MKKLLIFLLFATCHAYGQTFVLVPKELLEMANQSGIQQGFIQLKGLNRTTDTLIYSDGSHYYLIASGDGNNSPGTKIRVQITQVPMTGTPDTIPDPPPATIIDMVDAEASTFSEGWSRGKNEGLNWYGNTMSYSNVKDAFATYKHPVAYRRIEIWTERKDTHGWVGLSINGGAEVFQNLYNPTHEIPYMVWAFDVPMGVQEIKFRVLGTKIDASKNYYGLLDFYKIYR